MTEIIQRATIEGIVGHRNHAMMLFGESMQKLDEAFAALRKASGGSIFSVDRDQAVDAFHGGRREEFLSHLRKKSDAIIWRYLVDGHGFEELMDRQAREEFNATLFNDPPEVSVETANATLSSLMCNADMIFQRGIANAFSKLDRRFRTHDGFKIGAKIILNYAFDSFGSWNNHSNHDATFRDIERAFHVLDEKELPKRYAGIVGAIDDELRQGPYEARGYTAETEYFRAQVFKKGTLHIWFKRPDLVTKVNQLLATYYGAALGAGADTYEDDPLAQPGTSMCKTLGWFPTPAAVAKRIADAAEIDVSRHYTDHHPVHFRILEPSAGQGAIAQAIAEKMKTSGATYDLDMIEIEPGRVEDLQALRLGLVMSADFLTVKPDPIYDRIVMNPPFDHKQDIDHVVHALKFLAPGGRLVAIMYAGIEFRTDKKSVAFRERIESLRGTIQDLPPGSFAESGTNVNTVMITVHLPSRQ